ncbi:hypothetical protein B0T17DRAFT_591473 [Bombardia bombarda]|uniref:DUF6987 domain-containing protein n=1 Tax=Bombardia bombarda TaxID=252184 RepID=A0AA40C1L6_9PEZI|nr:hypothetical protein B0T17DRAFT_591473 [Bombardia bombarda]
MSDIAKKTLPPGARAGKKGGSTIAETAESASEAAAPRSVASLPPLSAKDEGDEDVSASPSHYTYKEGKSLQNIDEEEDAPIKMTDDDHNSQESLVNVESNPAEDESENEFKTISSKKGSGDTAPEASEAPKTAEEGVEEASSAEAPHETDTSSKTSLTEEAKREFDEQSENQPTSEARDSFLKSAKDGVTSAASGITGLTGKKSQQDKTSEAPEDLKKTPSDVEEKTPVLGEASVSGKQPSEPAGEAVADTTEQAPGEEVAADTTEQAPGGDVAADTAEQVPADLQEQPADESGAQVPAGEAEKPASELEKTEKARSELGSQAGSQQLETQQQGSQQGAQQEGTQQEGTQEEGQPQDSQIQDFGEGAPQTGESVTVPEQLDFNVLRNGTVNKGGNVISEDGKVVGRVTQGILQYLIGKKVDENGDIWSENGKVIGKAEPISDTERDEMLREPSPFEAFPDAVVDGNGMVVSNGEWVGKVVSGDIKALRGRSVDADGDILDKGGNVIGHAERWEPEPEPEPEPEAEVDRSILAGKRVNKAGNVVDSGGQIFGRVVEGDVKKMIGRMCDKNGNILSESGDILGRAEVVPEGEREGQKEGPFAELEGCTVAKDGKVVTPSGDIVGRLVTGDPKVLFGRSVDEDGDVLDKNGNTIGKAERWEPEEVVRPKNPMTGRKVNREYNVLDEDGNIIGKLTSGDPQVCIGKEIDEDGDVVDYKGTVVGHCSLLDDIPKEEETPEEKAKREQIEEDRKIAIKMATAVDHCLDKIRPICKLITDKIDIAEATPEDERDEEALVREVRPLIEEGGRILNEAKGVIKGLDPDGRIAANAKHKTAAREATPEEYHLADLLKDLTGDVTNCIENAKRKLELMPHAKKELNPLWGLLSEPLFQILAAVGLLLAGVLGLVGRLLSGLGLGGLLDGLLGTLGINRVLEGLGIGSITGSKKKKTSGGLLSGVLG